MRRATLALALAVTSALLAPTAGAEVLQEQGVRVSLQSEIAPKALPRTGTAPVAVSFGGRLQAPGARELPQLRRLRIELNRGGRIDAGGLPVCPEQRIRIATTSRAFSACRGALVGRGSFGANIVLDGQEPYPSTGRLLIFNGRRDGRPALFGHIYSDRPFAASFLIVFEISQQAKGAFGTVLTASLPEALGDWGYLTAIEMRLFRTYRSGGEQRSYISAGCPAPRGFGQALFPLARASFAFAGGIAMRTTLTRSCRVR